MTFYSYGLNADRVSALSYSQAAPAASPSVAALTKLTGPHPLILAVFGPAPISQIWFSVGKGLHSANAQAITPTRQKFASKFQMAPVASSSVATTLEKYLGLRLLTAASTQSPSLSFPRLSHAVVAVQQAAVSTVIRMTGRSIKSGQTSAAALTRALGHAIFTTGGPGQSAGLLRGVVLVRGVLAASAATVLKAAGKTALTIQSSMVITTPKTLGHLCGVAAASIISAARSFPLHINAVFSEVLLLALGSANYRRLLAAVATEAIAVRNGLSVSRFAVWTSTGGLLRTSGRSIAATSASAAAAVKSAARLPGALSPNAASNQRGIGLPRGIAGSSVVALQPAGSHLLAVLRAVQSQIAAAPSLLTHTVFVVINRTQASTAVLSFMLSYLRTRAALDAQAAILGKTVGRTMGLAFNATQSSVRSSARLLSFLAGAAVSLTNSRVGFRTFAVAATMGVALARGSSVVRSLVSPQIVAFMQQRGKALAVAAAAGIGLRRLISKLLAVLSAGAVTAGRGDTKIIGAATPNTAVMIRPRGIILRAIIAQVAGAAPWYWLFVPEWAYQQTSLLPPDGGPAEPPSFGPVDPSDRTTFAFNWASRGDPNDPIVSAKVISVPPGLSLYGPAFISGSLVETIVVPSVPPLLPGTYSLRCSATFASGRRSSFSIPVPVRAL